MRLNGTLLKIENYSGDFTNDNNENVAYEGMRLHVLDDVEVVKVKVPKDHRAEAGQLVEKSPIDINVSASASVGRGGAPYITYTYRGLAGEDVDRF
jgi:hypothetical protein